MAQMQNAQSVALQLEKVRDKLPLLYERDDILLTMIQQRGDVERVSSRNMRLPLQIRPGGKAGLANLDGGDLGPRFGNHLRRGASHAGVFPQRRRNHQARRIQHQFAGKSRRERRQARSEKWHGAVPQLPRQSRADCRQRRARHYRIDCHVGFAFGRRRADQSGDAAGRGAFLLQPDRPVLRSHAHIERWMPPETYGSPQQWYAQTVERDDGISIPALGPYPQRGEYEHCFTLQGQRGEFIPLSPSACEAIVRAVEFARAQPRAAHRAALTHREAQRERDWEAHADAVFNDATPAFHGAPFVASA
jgi:hypothetical protein